MNLGVPYNAGNSSIAEDLTGFLKRNLLNELVDIGTLPIMQIILSKNSAHRVRQCCAFLATKFIDTDQRWGRCVECSYVSSSSEAPRFAEFQFKQRQITRLDQIHFCPYAQGFREVKSHCIVRHTSRFCANSMYRVKEILHLVCTRYL
jgi:hypothetical protein